MHLRLHWEHQSELRVSQSVMASGPGGGGRGVCIGKNNKKKKRKKKARGKEREEGEETGKRNSKSHHGKWRV